MPDDQEDEPQDPAFCGFCGKGNAEVLVMVRGPDAMICDECVDAAMWIVRDERSKRGVTMVS